MIDPNSADSIERRLALLRLAEPLRGYLLKRRKMINYLRKTNFGQITKF